MAGSISLEEQLVLWPYFRVEHDHSPLEIRHHLPEQVKPLAAE
jgi:hypothetical protein